MSKTAVVIGGTGAIGTHLVRELCQSGEFAKVRSVVRKKRPASYYFDGADSEKHAAVLEQVEVDFDNLQPEAFAGFEYGFSAFGTTRKDAGGAAQFEKIDFGYNVKAADLMKAGGVKDMQLVSSTGAKASAWLLYPSVKGRIEEHLKGLKFDRLTIWRPAFLAGRPKGRPVEVLANITPGCYKVHVRTVARAMLFNVRQPAHATAAATYENTPLKEFVTKVGGKDSLADGI